MVLRDEVEVDRLAADRIARVVFVCSGEGDSPGDIERTVLRHGRRTVSVHVDFAELRRVGEFRGDFLTFRTDTGARRMVMLFAGQGLWRGEMDVIRPGAGEILECGATHKIDYAENTVDLRFPRACFGEPRWLQMRAESGWARLEAGRATLTVSESSTS